jgi:hypothetical protein
MSLVPGTRLGSYEIARTRAPRSREGESKEELLAEIDRILERMKDISAKERDVK